MINLKKMLGDIYKNIFTQKAVNRFLRICEANDPFSDMTKYGTFKGISKFKLGIIKEFTHYHKHYIAACRELNVSYEVIDMSGSDWLASIKRCNCDAFLVWPSALSIVHKQMYDERLKAIKEMGKVMYPSYDEIWIWESKRRMHLWLASNDVPCPKTWIFYSPDQAIEFLKEAHYPLIYKPDFGDCARGIQVFEKKEDAINFAKKIFEKGLKLGPVGNCREWGTILLQEYLTNVQEWRMVRLGDDYFGYEKVKKGYFASGSGIYRHGRPSDELLNFTKKVCNKGKFDSMNLDVFLLTDGRIVVNELQTVFGASHPAEFCVIDGKAGKMVDSKNIGRWEFVEGRFCDNHFCNLRVNRLLKILEARS